MPEKITIQNPCGPYAEHATADYIEKYLSETYHKHFKGFNFFFDETWEYVTIIDIKWED